MAFTRMQRAMCKEPFAKNHLQRTTCNERLTKGHLQRTIYKLQTLATQTSQKDQSQKTSHKKPAIKTVTQARPQEIAHGQLKDRSYKVSHERALKGEHHTLPLVQPSKHALQHMPFNNTCPSEPVLQSTLFISRLSPDNKKRI